jgi:hypothetical protein
MLQRTFPAGFIAPCLPTKTHKLPAGSQWLHEIKHDGFRVIARKDGARVRLYSRLGNDLMNRFPLIAESLARLRSRSCTIDGEAVACGDDGVPSFDRIRYRQVRHFQARIGLFVPIPTYAKRELAASRKPRGAMETHGEERAEQRSQAHREKAAGQRRRQFPKGRGDRNASSAASPRTRPIYLASAGQQRRQDCARKRRSAPPIRRRAVGVD